MLGLWVFDAVRVFLVCEQSWRRLKREHIRWSRRVVGAVGVVLFDGEVLNDESLHFELHLQVGRLVLLLEKYIHNDNNNDCMSKRM